MYSRCAVAFNKRFSGSSSGCMRAFPIAEVQSAEHNERRLAG